MIKGFSIEVEQASKNDKHQFMDWWFGRRLEEVSHSGWLAALTPIRSAEEIAERFAVFNGEVSKSTSDPVFYEHIKVATERYKTIANAGRLVTARLHEGLKGGRIIGVAAAIETASTQDNLQSQGLVHSLIRAVITDPAKKEALLNPPDVRIESLVVEAEYQRLGVGTRLLGEVLSGFNGSSKPVISVPEEAMGARSLLEQSSFRQGTEQGTQLVNDYFSTTGEPVSLLAFSAPSVNAVREATGVTYIPFRHELAPNQTNS